VLGLKVTEQWDEPEGRGVIVEAVAGASIEMYEMSIGDARFRKPVPAICSRGRSRWTSGPFVNLPGGNALDQTAQSIRSSKRVTSATEPRPWGAVRLRTTNLF